MVSVLFSGPGYGTQSGYPQAGYPQGQGYQAGGYPSSGQPGVGFAGGQQQQAPAGMVPGYPPVSHEAYQQQVNAAQVPQPSQPPAGMVQPTVPPPAGKYVAPPTQAGWYTPNLINSCTRR